MSSPSSNSNEFSDENRSTLIEVARRSVWHGLECGAPSQHEPADYSPPLRQRRATFVTLHRGRTLRGCIGVVQPRRPLVCDVATNAFNAAFQDPRFDPLERSEFDELDIQISVLGPKQPVLFVNEIDLLEQLQTGDGLELHFGKQRGLLLPSVWEKITDKRQFWLALKEKAGLASNFWSDEIVVTTFSTESFGV